jgi:uncharacterized membrane protein
MFGRNMKWILLASLLANALLVGFIAAHAGRGKHPMAPIAMSNSAEKERGARGKSDDATRAALRAALDSERPAMETAGQKIRDARKKGAELIQAELLDMVALDEALVELRAGRAEQLEAFHRAIRTAATTLNADQRAKLARLLDRVPGQRAARDKPQGSERPAGPAPR